MTTDESDRRRILARRGRFLRATLYGATAGTLLTACDQSGAACHSVRRNMPRSVAKTLGCDAPHPCLSVAIVDAGAPPAVADAGADSKDED
jgi:hypothetical protein